MVRSFCVCSLRTDYDELLPVCLPVWNMAIIRVDNSCRLHAGLMSRAYAYLLSIESGPGSLGSRQSNSISWWECTPLGSLFWMNNNQPGHYYGHCLCWQLILKSVHVEPLIWSIWIVFHRTNGYSKWFIKHSWLSCAFWAHVPIAFLLFCFAFVSKSFSRSNLVTRCCWQTGVSSNRIRNWLTVIVRSGPNRFCADLDPIRFGLFPIHYLLLWPSKGRARVVN